MLVGVIAVGAVAAAAIEGAVIYGQSNEISELKKEKEKYDSRLQEVINAGKEQIKEISTRLDKEREEVRRLKESNVALRNVIEKQREEISLIIAKKDKQVDEMMVKINEVIVKKDKQIDEITAQYQGLAAKLEAFLKLPDINTVIQCRDQAENRNTFHANLQECDGIERDESDDDIDVVSRVSGPSSDVENVLISPHDLAVSK